MTLFAAARSDKLAMRPFAKLRGTFVWFHFVLLYLCVAVECLLLLCYTYFV